MTLGRTSVWQRAAAWLAAYAFVLQTALAPMAASAEARRAAIEVAAITDCVAHDEAGDRAAVPVGHQHDHDVACKRCVGCPTPAIAAPDNTNAVIELATITIRWIALGHSAPDRDWLGSERARGPPAMT